MGGEIQLRQLSTALPKYSAGPVGQQIHSIYKGRLGVFTDNGQYAGQNLRSKMYEGKASGEEYIKLSVYSPPDLTRPSFQEATSHEFERTHVGEAFGPSWSTHWIKVQLKVPSSLQKKEHLELHWDAGNEGLIWSEDGIPLQGLTGNGDRIEWILPDSFRDGKFHTFYIEMACNGMFGNAPGGDSIQPPNPNKYFTLFKAEIVAVNLEARQLYIDFWIVGDAAREFPENSWESHEALQLCNKVMDTFEAAGGSQDSIIECRKILSKYIGDVNSSKVYDTDRDHLIYAIGNCHIDTCWLWPWAETKRKIARSFANQCDLIDRYPEHRFVASQAQQYKWLEQLYPAVFDRVKSRVKSGQFQPIGGSWVEHDTNMPSGESLSRQFLYGQRFFESHFGERCRTFWLPDTFGYSTQLPQVSRLAGMSRFFTQKLSWNNINIFPHSTFKWVSLDGSQVICHMAPANTYTADAHFGDVSRSLSQNKSMDQDATSLLAFGKGDGGGGPTWEHLEKLRRCRGMSDTTGLLPRVKMGDSVEDFFDRLERKAESGTKFVTWYGELYLELHRGTYTSQANNKWNNRKTELMLHDIEYLATLATIKDRSYKYPKKDLDDIWENTLLCQFHDCLPGSAIEMCYDDSDELYDYGFKTGKKLMKDALSVLGFKSDASYEKGDTYCAINTLPWPRMEFVRIPDKTKISAPGPSTYALVNGGPGITNFCPWPDSDPEPMTSIKEVRKGVFQLENNLYKIEVEGGSITSIWDFQADREIVPKGAKANQLVIFDDKPLYWQAWDVEVYHLETRTELPPGTSRIVENGAFRVSLETETRISENSWIKTTISLSTAFSDGSGDNSPAYIEMTSEVEWRETMKFLKVEFPVDITNTEASYETQYGIIRRPTHYNTSWDMAKFEVCCHKWADLSENGYGVSILNDSKYGFATSGNVMRLSLLRAPKAPDAHADMGRHHIRYAIFPHSGPLDHRTVRTARNFNTPLQLISAPRSTVFDSKIESLFSSLQLQGSPALVLDTIKRGEDDEDVSRGELAVRKGRSVIVRIYESLGGKARGEIRTGELEVQRVWKCNLLEDDGEELAIGEEGEVEVELRAFEVATFRLQLRE
ncbi:Glycoside hydrolase, 38 vacuolar alpha mannosidase [Lecanora helva]